MESEITILKVSSKSSAGAVAGAIAHTFEQNHNSIVDLIIIGAGALNQAIKAIVIARDFIKSESIDLISIPYFTTVEFGNKIRKGLRIRIKKLEKGE